MREEDGVWAGLGWAGLGWAGHIHAVTLVLTLAQPSRPKPGRHSFRCIIICISVWQSTYNNVQHNTQQLLCIYVWGLCLQIVDDPYIWVNAGNNSSLFLCLLMIEARKTHERGNSAHHDVRSNLVVLLALISGCELWRLECAGCGIWPYCDYQTHLNCSFCHKYLSDYF